MGDIKAVNTVYCYLSFVKQLLFPCLCTVPYVHIKKNPTTFQETFVIKFCILIAVMI